MHVLSILSILMLFFGSCSSCSSGDKQTETTETIITLDDYLEGYDVLEVEEESPEEIAEVVAVKEVKPVVAKKPSVKKVSKGTSVVTSNETPEIKKTSNEEILTLLLATPLEPVEFVEELVEEPVVEDFIEPYVEEPIEVFTNIVPELPTFVQYKTTNIITSDVVEWRTKGLEPKSLKASLVGVNVNSWLETPEYFTVLKNTARAFPIRVLLDNLVSNNPTLKFNDPEVVRRVLNEDIYLPYMKELSNYKRTLQFADINEVVSYTRKYHIYGAAVDGLPYFGRPVEGGKERNINLGLLRGQIDEISAKLPDTDVFLVAMINVIPNWLEEGIDIHHVPQQQVEVLIYAFDRQGKFLGGGGLPTVVKDSGNTYYMEQKIVSEFWQKGISRGFYILPAYNIMNTKDFTQEPKVSTVKYPTDSRPRLNGNQRYVLSAMNYLRAVDENVKVPFFDEVGGKLIEVKKLKAEKIVLPNNVMIHKNKSQEWDEHHQRLVENSETEQLENLEQKEESIVQSEQIELSEDFAELQTIETSEITIDAESDISNDTQTIAYLPLSGKFNEIQISEEEEQDSPKSSKQTYTPSNEGDKIEEVLIQAQEGLSKSPYTYTNESHYTNSVLPYDLEMDPVEYSIEQRKYAIVPYNVREFKKEYKKDTKELIRQINMELDEKLFWQEYQFGLIKKHLKETETSITNAEDVENKKSKEELLKEDVEFLYNEWKKSYKKYTAITIKKLKLERELDMNVQLKSSLAILQKRNDDYIEDKYFLKQHKIEPAKQKVSDRVAKIEDSVNKDINNTNKQEILLATQQELDIAESEEATKYKSFVAKIPKSMEIVVDMDKALLRTLGDSVSLSGVDERVFLAGVGEGKKSPLIKEREKIAKKSNRELKRRLKRVSYEGFMLGITRSWRVKTALDDRLVEL